MSTGLIFDDIAIGNEPPSLSKGPLTTAHIMRWSAAMENWHRVHYDRTFAVEHDNLPDVLINGSLKRHFYFQLLRDWIGHSGWIWKVSFQFRAMSLAGDDLVTWGRVTDKRALADYGLIELDVGIRNGDGKESAPGRATVAVPLSRGASVPYPFVAPDLA